MPAKISFVTAAVSLKQVAWHLPSCQLTFYLIMLYREWQRYSTVAAGDRWRPYRGSSDGKQRAGLQARLAYRLAGQASGLAYLSTAIPLKQTTVCFSVDIDRGTLTNATQKKCWHQRPSIELPVLRTGSMCEAEIIACSHLGISSPYRQQWNPKTVHQDASPPYRHIGIISDLFQLIYSRLLA